MACTLKLPVGIDSFEKIRRNKFYYIDKTKLIEQILRTKGVFHHGIYLSEHDETQNAKEL